MSDSFRDRVRERADLLNAERRAQEVREEHWVENRERRASELASYLTNSIVEFVSDETDAKVLIELRRTDDCVDCIRAEPRHHVLRCSYFHDKYGAFLEQHICDVVLHPHEIASAFDECISIETAIISPLNREWREQSRWLRFGYEEAIARTTYAIIETMAHTVAEGGRIQSRESDSEG